MSTNIAQVTKFLKAFKGAADVSTITYYRNQKNLDVFTVLGISQYHRTEYILGLKPSHYAQGPLEDDKGRESSWWIFGTEIEGREIYIKIQISSSRRGPKPICMSFHIADHPLSYPFRKEN